MFGNEEIQEIQSLETSGAKYHMGLGNHNGSKTETANRIEKQNKRFRRCCASGHASCNDMGALLSKFIQPYLNLVLEQFVAGASLKGFHMKLKNGRDCDGKFVVVSGPIHISVCQFPAYRQVSSMTAAIH